MSWSSTMSWSHAQVRAEILQNIRSFFAVKKVTEVETPIMSIGTITDVHLDAFSCRYDFFLNSPEQHTTPMYLQTSPEFAMKRLLASGYGCIYQICKAFRHEQSGKYHNPEFTMLEWYRVGFNHFDLMAEVSALLIEVLACKSPTQLSYQTVFIEQVGIDPLACHFDELINILKEQHKYNEWLSEENDIDLLLQVIFSEIIEPKIGLDAPCFIYNFPSSQASLAKISTDDSRVAERFECYYHGIELANGFNELTDGESQKNRFINDNKKRQQKGLEQRPIDHRLINALSSGLPQCAGVALGVDRLVMLALELDNIEQVLSFNIERA